MREILTPSELIEIYIAEGMEGKVKVFSIEIPFYIPAGGIVTFTFILPAGMVSIHRSPAVITSNYYHPELQITRLVLDPGTDKAKDVLLAPRRITAKTTIDLGAYVVKEKGSYWEFRNNTGMAVIVRVEFASVVWMDKVTAKEEYIPLLLLMRARARELVWQPTPV